MMKSGTRIASTALVAAIGIGVVKTGADPVARSAFLSDTSAAQAVVRTAALRLVDGHFTGQRIYAFYGYVKVEATVQDGKLADVRVLEYPSDNRRSQYINGIAIPYLVQEAVDAQSASVDLISGATFTSSAFTKSLATALRKAGA